MSPNTSPSLERDDIQNRLSSQCLLNGNTSVYDTPRSSKAGDEDPACVVGMACRLPGGIKSPSDLWKFLIEKKSAQGKIPTSRFNASGYYSRSADHAGVMNVDGGYFIDEDLRTFDNGFFDINNLEATYMDPQQRKLLEVVFECFESAGVSMGDISDSNTGVYVASFTQDYFLMQMRNPDHLHRYHGTGSGTTLLANRISHVFNLHGPSFTIDTACSSSIHCLHAAISALKAGECEGAIVAGTNLLLTPEPFVAAMKTGVLSSSATCQTFDSNADGYGRAEGVDAIYLKRLSAAVRDGDTIHAVIRGTAINSNGRTPGVTLPSADYQEAVILKAYNSAGIDVFDTDYVECHGTGTAVGDPIEVEALSRCFSSIERPPLMIGSVKSNLGHSGATSGLTSLIKVALAFQHDRIPPMMAPKSLNPKLRLDDYRMRIVTETEKWPREIVRRASINSFGYGGANAHVILESFDSFLSRPDPFQDEKTVLKEENVMVTLPISAVSQESLSIRTKQILDLAQKCDAKTLMRMAFTLGLRTPHLGRRASIVATVTPRELQSESEIVSASQAAIDSRKWSLPLAFVFTGQGAQYALMGSEILQESQYFRAVIQRLDEVLQALPSPYKPSWTLIDVINQPPETTEVNQPTRSQALCTAIQIALVQLLSTWDIRPSTVIGHSSGEIAAAFTAGVLSESEAILVAYLRGYAVEKVQTDGAMMATALSAGNAETLISQLGLTGQVCVACYNSPGNVTLSGEREALNTLARELTAMSTFCRVLETGGRAYHSSAMAEAGRLYESLLSDIAKLKNRGQQTANVSMYSTVHSKRKKAVFVDHSTDLPSYWRANLESPVQFSAALEHLASAHEYHLIEIGPHPALKGPIRQGVTSRSLPYTHTLARNETSNLSIKRFAGTMFNYGHKLNWSNVNVLPWIVQKPTDEIPSYPWDYSNGLPWFESREASEIRNRQYPRHELLGSLQPAGNGIDSCWRNTLRLKEVPWVADHKVEDQIVFPAAGYMAIAIEALSQILGSKLSQDDNFEFQNVSFNAALVVKDEGNGADSEIHTIMAPRRLSAKQLSSTYYDFSISSWKSNHVLTHCSGGIRLASAVSDEGLVNIQDTAGYRTWPMSRWYEKADEKGLVFGPLMRSIVALQTDRNRVLPDSICNTYTKPSTLDASPTCYRIHPIIIDACLQAAILSAAAGNLNKLRPYLPVFLPKCVMWASTFAGPSSKAYIHVRSHKTGISNLKADCTLRDGEGRPMVDFDGIKLSLYDGKLAKSSSNDLHLQRHPIMRVFWKPDVAHLHTGTQRQLDGYIRDFLDNQYQGFCPPESAYVAALLDLLGHKNPRMRVLEIQEEVHSNTQNGYLKLLDDETTYPRYRAWSKVVMEESKELPVLGTEIFDVVLVSSSNAQISWNQLQPNLSQNGSIIVGNSEEALTRLQAAGFATILVQGDVILATRVSPQSNPKKTDVVILTHKPSPAAKDFADALEAHLCSNNAQTVSIVEFESLRNVSPITSETLVISLLELENELLASLSEEHMNLLRTVTDTVKDLLWITGANMLSEPNPDLTMAPGLSRSIMMEQPSLNFNILDIGPIESLEKASIDITCDNVVRIMAGARVIDDKEFIQLNSLLYISRLGSDFSMNDLFRRRLGMAQGFQETTLESARVARLEVGQAGITDSLYFQSHSAELLEPPPKDYIDIKVQAVSLNAKDIYAISGRVETRNATKSLEYVGIVTAAGPEVEGEFEIGCRVLVCIPNDWSTVARVPAWQAHKLLPKEDTKVMATLPVAWGAALFAVRERAHLRAGETILVHSGAGAFGSAVISLAQHIGAEVYTTVGSSTRREFLIHEMGIPEDHIFSSRDDSFEEEIRKATNKRGVDVVINSLVGDLMHASWRCVGDFGRFVEVGKKELLDAGKLDMAVFARGATFTAFDNTEMLFHPDDYYRKIYISMVKEILSMYRLGKITPVPITEFDISEISQAYRFFSSKDRVGKVVISLENPNSIIKVMPSKYTSTFSSDKSYLLIGALGGLGRSISSWMRSRGAHKFVFMARSGASKKEAKDLVDYLKRTGARVQVVQGDVSNSLDVEKAVVECKALGPIGGVLHAAMGLHEDLFSRMSNEGWHNSVRSKWRGAWNLHNALQSQGSSPDFFLLTSSMTGTVGVATETNYCAANAFLDAFSYWRRRQGYPTVAIGLGMVSEVGYLHENPQIEALLLRRGIQPLNEDEFLQVVDFGISNAGRDIEKSTVTNSHMLTGMETFGVRKLLEKGFEVTHTVMDDQRSSILSAALELDRSGNTGNSTDFSGGTNLDWIRGLPEVAAKSLIKETTASSLKEALSHVIGRKFSNLILMPFDKIDYNRSFAQLGVDSMIASEFRAWFWNMFVVDIPFLDFLSPDKNLDAVVSFAETSLAKESKGKSGE